MMDGVVQIEMIIIELLLMMFALFAGYGSLIACMCTNKPKPRLVLFIISLIINMFCIPIDAISILDNHGPNEEAISVMNFLGMLSLIIRVGLMITCIITYIIIYKKKQKHLPTTS